MKTILSLVLFLIIGFVGSKWFVSRTKIRLPFAGLYITGMEFFFIGILLGPAALDLITPEVLRDLKPIVYLALGWAGLLFGIELSWPQVKRVSRSIIKYLLADTLVVSVIVFIVSFMLIRRLYSGVGGPDVVFAAMILAITAALSSPAIIAIHAKRLPARGRFTRVVKVSSALSPVFPLLLFSFFYTTVHPGFLGLEGAGSGLLWWLLANAMGIGMGFIMVLFTVERCSENERSLLIMGTVMLVGGLCYYLTFSSLYTAMIMGIVVANFSGRREAVFKQLHEHEKTLFVAFLIIVGSMVSISGAFMLVLLAAYLAIRLLLRAFVSSWLIERTYGEFKTIRHGRGLVFTAQGGMALAIAIEYRMSTNGAFADTVFAVIAFAVVLNEVLGFALTRRAFRASGEIPAGRNAAGQITNG
jgi:Kef-type K+ transport system membrane component KefB